MTVPTSAHELRLFLDQCVNATSPIVYTDRAGIEHQVFLAKIQEVPKSMKRDESVVALTFIETTPETQEASPGAIRALEIFLLQCVDSTLPVEYEDRLNHKHRVFMTRMELSKRTAKQKPDEWLYNLTMVDAFGGVFVYNVIPLTITIATTITLQTHAAAQYDDVAEYGEAEYET